MDFNEIILFGMVGSLFSYPYNIAVAILAGYLMWSWWNNGGGNKPKY